MYPLFSPITEVLNRQTDEKGPFCLRTEEYWYSSGESLKVVWVGESDWGLGKGPWSMIEVRNVGTGCVGSRLWQVTWEWC